MVMDLLLPTSASANAAAMLVVERVTRSLLITPLRDAEPISRIDVASVVESYTRSDAVTPVIVRVLAQMLVLVVGCVNE